MKNTAYIILAIAFAPFARAQVTSDALMFSDVQPAITARSAAVGNALGALGGDIACLSMNPAGIAIYRNSEVTFTPTISFSTTKTKFAGETSRDNRTSFNISNFGLVFAQYNENKPKWFGLGFGLSLNRIASFHQDFSLDGVSYGSRLVTIAENSQGTLPANLNPFEDQLAYNAYLTDNPQGGGNYVSALTDANYVRKTQYVSQTGGINELAFAFAGNYKNKLYIGGGLGIDFLTFKERKTYTETEETDSISFKSMEFMENRRVNGVGANVRLGIIYRVNHLFRVGLSGQTPTAFGNTERYYTSMRGVVIYNDTLRDNSLDCPQDGLYPHRLATPWIATVSLGVLLGKKGKAKWGFWALDVDYVGYRTAKFALKPSDKDPANQSYINNLNDNVDALLRSSIRVRTGMEFVADIFRIRAGYRFQSSPYQVAADSVSDMRHDISLGFGLRQKHFFLDITYIHTIKDFQYIPYASSTILQMARTRFSGGQIMVTVGVRFGQKLD